MSDCRELPVADPGEWPWGLGPSLPHFRPKCKFFGRPPLSQGLDDRPPSEGLDPSFSSNPRKVKE